MQISDIPSRIVDTVRRGTAIPALPLALTSSRQFSPKYQRALLRYYIDSGAGGIAVGVHSTQFEIRAPQHGLFEPVLEFASREIDRFCEVRNREVLKVAGVCGSTEQAAAEAQFAREKGYHAALVSLKGYDEKSVAPMVDHCREVAAILPVVGFYLQCAVGGPVLSREFWRGFAQIPNVLAIKIAPFHRYRTLEVLHAILEIGRENDIALYTGNDDTIVTDLLTDYRLGTSAGMKQARIVGGLLGQWAVWTRTAVDMLEEIRSLRANATPIPPELLTRAAQLTDANGAVFDAANNFAGCIPGINEVLRRQGLLEGAWCLDPEETLSPGQAEEITRVQQAYPHLTDDDFVSSHLSEWLTGSDGSD